MTATTIRGRFAGANDVNQASVWLRVSDAFTAGPTGGSLLLFKLPLTSLENRPLELIVEAPPGSQPPHRKRIELDI